MDNSLQIVNTNREMQEWADKIRACRSSSIRVKTILKDLQLDHVYIACGYTDLRLGIDGLSNLVQLHFELDPYTNTPPSSLFISLLSKSSGETR